MSTSIAVRRRVYWRTEHSFCAAARLVVFCDMKMRASSPFTFAIVHVPKYFVFAWLFIVAISSNMAALVAGRCFYARVRVVQLEYRRHLTLVETRENFKWPTRQQKAASFLADQHSRSRSRVCAKRSVALKKRRAQAAAAAAAAFASLTSLPPPKPSSRTRRRAQLRDADCKRQNANHYG